MEGGVGRRRGNRGGGEKEQTKDTKLGEKTLDGLWKLEKWKKITKKGVGEGEDDGQSDEAMTPTKKVMEVDGMGGRMGCTRGLLGD